MAMTVRSSRACLAFKQDGQPSCCAMCSGPYPLDQQCLQSLGVRHGDTVPYSCELAAIPALRPGG
jgi:hypothetical protein